LATRKAWQRPALRADEELDQDRPVSNLELFSDLVFVVVISRLAHHLEQHVDAAGVGTFAVLFLAVFWVWNGSTYYAERFESDGLENRIATFVAMIPVAGLAVFSDEGLGDGYAGFAASYLLARAVNQAMWLRAARHERVFRPVAARFGAGFLLGAAIIVSAFFASGALRGVLVALAVLVEVAAPAFTIRHQSALPRLSTSKFPERFGLLTLIVLGESVVGVIVGLSELHEAHLLDALGVVAGVLGLAIGFAIWWMYFDFVARRAPRPQFAVGLLWVYLHLVAITGITATGAGISVVIAESAGSEHLDAGRYLLVGGVGLTLLGIAALQTTLFRAADEPTHAVLGPGIEVAAAVVVVVLGVLDLGWSATALLALALLGVLAPCVYGAVVWFRQTLPEQE
jgi:low temperature requirement protein LtrA